MATTAATQARPATGAQKARNIGRIVQIIGPVLDFFFYD